MNKNINIIFGIIGIAVVMYAGYRTYTQINRVQAMLEKDGYRAVDIKRNYKLAGRCSGEDYQSFSFSGTKGKQKFTGNVCCELLFLMMEDCSILQTHPVKP